MNLPIFFFVKNKFFFTLRHYKLIVQNIFKMIVLTAGLWTIYLSWLSKVYIIDKVVNRDHFAAALTFWKSVCRSYRFYPGFVGNVIEIDLCLLLYL